MAAPVSLETYSDALVVLATAGIVVPAARRLGLSPVLSYLAAGAVLGPLGLGSLIGTYPFLYWVTVVDAKNVAGIAQLGVVFLLFLIGLELSYERLRTMRRLVFGLGGLQVAISAAVIAGAAALCGGKPAEAVILGLCLALSSTAIVIDLLAGQDRLATTAGRASFAVLLAQDLAVVPILLFVSIVGTRTDGSVVTTLVLALANGVLALGLIVVFGRMFLRPLFHLVASAGTSDLFVAAALLVVVGAGVGAAAAGLPMSLGAFVAGLLLSETEFRKAIESRIEPFKGLLLGLFFFTIGMNIDLRELVREPLWLLVCTIALVVLKSGILVGLARAFRLPWPAAVETGLLLGPGGEFAFVGIGLATVLGVIDTAVATFALAVTSITMAFIPGLSLVARKWAPRLEPSKAALDAELLAKPQAAAGHAIVVGHGRVGQVVCAMLDRHGLRYVAVDKNASAVRQHRRHEREVYYGDATNPDFLKACGLGGAAAVIVTTGSKAEVDEVVAEVRRTRPDILIVARAHDATHARHLYEIGVTDAVPETIEASLQVSEAALVGLGVGIGPVVASIHEKRDEFRRQLQKGRRGRE
jgi:CPA2 family monovalent cation:H+ antiporter-2